MSNIQRDLIDYYGIDEWCSMDKKNFTQFNLEEVFCIPVQKPDIDKINAIWVKSCIVSQEIIETPVGKSIEGQILTGYKLLIYGEINLRVQYVVGESNEAIHTARTIFPFCSYIALPADINPNTIIKSNVLIEDIFSERINERCIYNNITLMILADVC